VESQTVAVRTRFSKDLGAMTLNAFIEHLSADTARLGYSISKED
jgi:threonyl-tRNA synthetase